MNKKIIKTIATITCGLGIATAIPTIATSCGAKKHSYKIECDVDYTKTEFEAQWNENHWYVNPIKFAEVTFTYIDESIDINNWIYDHSHFTFTDIGDEGISRPGGSFNDFNEETLTANVEIQFGFSDKAEHDIKPVYLGTLTWYFFDNNGNIVSPKYSTEYTINFSQQQ